MCAQGVGSSLVAQIDSVQVQHMCKPYFVSERSDAVLLESHYFDAHPAGEW